VRRSSARRTSTICWPRQGRAGRCSTASSPTCIGGGTRAALEAARLFAEIRDAGYRGSALTVRRYLHPFRATLTAPERPPTQLKVRDVVGWIMREPGKLNDDEQNRLQALLDRCPELNALAGHVSAFAEMIRAPTPAGGGDRSAGRLRQALKWKASSWPARSCSGSRSCSCGTYGAGPLGSAATTSNCAVHDRNAARVRPDPVPTPGRPGNKATLTAASIRGTGVVLREAPGGALLLRACAIVVAVLGLTPGLQWVHEVPLLSAAVLAPVGIFGVSGYRAARRADRVEAGAVAGAFAGAAGAGVGPVPFKKGDRRSRSSYSGSP
jgi:hypothetical protein